MLLNADFPSYNFDVIDGVTYQIDLSEPSKFAPKGELANAEANRIKNLMYNGQPVTDDMEFVDCHKQLSRGRRRCISGG